VQQRIVVLLVFLCACGLPRDPGKTLQHVQHGTLRAGAALNPPWVSGGRDRVSGVEVALVEALAQDLRAQVTWVRGSESQLMAALKDRELDIVVGGLTGDGPWKKEVGVSRPFYAESLIVSSPDGKTGHLKGASVEFEAGDPVAVYLRKKGAHPVPVQSLDRSDGPVAGASWKLAALGRPTSGVLLHQSRHIMAVSPGENAWLLRLDRHLHHWEDSIPAMLKGPGR
jgi:polar amino acid transport system substrate-binding protein